ncbi:MAG TPA: hypothetical protein DEP47_11505 [Chloroflexi bacterium]|nr:hypothetical protein [Chloroflexota bacterium]
MMMETYLLLIFLLANSINILSILMFIARVKWPKNADLFGYLAILMGLPALALAVIGAIQGFGISFGLAPLLYAAFTLFALIVDVILKIEFRNPRRLVILLPFLLFYFVPLMMMWGMMWLLGLGFWIITGVTYFATVVASFYALNKGVG